MGVFPGHDLTCLMSSFTYFHLFPSLDPRIEALANPPIRAPQTIDLRRCKDPEVLGLRTATGRSLWFGQRKTLKGDSGGTSVSVARVQRGPLEVWISTPLPPRHNFHSFLSYFTS